MRKDRVLSLVIAAGYLIGYAVMMFSQPQGTGRPGPPALGVIAIAIFLLLVLALIWFGDELGQYTGPVSRGYIDRKSPGCMVKFMGWLFPGLAFPPGSWRSARRHRLCSPEV
jgi:hypothetical protein